MAKLPKKKEKVEKVEKGDKGENVLITSLAQKKYRILLALLATLFMLIIMMELATYYLTSQSKRLIVESDLISRQNVIATQLAEEVYNVNIYVQKNIKDAVATNPSASQTLVRTIDLPQTAVYRIQNIKRYTDELNQINNALAQGGAVHFSDGALVEVDGIRQKDLQPFIKNIYDIWTPYLGLLGNFSNEIDKGEINLETMDYMVDYTRLYGHKLRFEINNLHNGMLYYIAKSSDRVTMVQVVGAILAIALFAALIFGAMNRLIRNDRSVEHARREMQEIMQTVNTGLFLLDKNLLIGNQYSNALVDVIGTDQLAGETLSTVLKNRISDKDLRTAEEFVEQLYNPRVKEKLVNSLNPLNKVLLHDASQTGDSRYLDFKFSRVYNNKEIVRILVNVNDVSESVRLEQRLEKERAENDLQIEMLTTILSVSPRLISEFISNTYTHIDKMNAVLKNPGSSQFELENKLKSIYREMHSLKGEASALKLHSFTKIASEAEDKLHAMQNQGKLSGNDFLSLAVHLDELLSLSKVIAGLGQRINEATSHLSNNPLANELAGFDGTTPSTPSLDVGTPPPSPLGSTFVKREDAKDELGDYLVQFGTEIATRQGKAVDIDVAQLAGKNIPAELSVVVREICVQLMRNALVHGIADSDTRVKRGKSYRGRITVALKEVDGAVMLSVEDDGQGIDYDAIREGLLKTGKYTDEQAASLTEPQLLNALFSSGFSTRGHTDEDGGRGVGLDLVKERVREFGGKVSVQSERGKFTRFIIKLPVTTQ